MASVATIQQVIDMILDAVSAFPYPPTVNTVTTSDASQPLKGIVTTFRRRRKPFTAQLHQVAIRYKCYNN